MTRTEARALQEVHRVRVCRGCERELPLTEEYYRQAPFVGGIGWRKKCRRCCHADDLARDAKARATARETEAQKPAAKWIPRLAGEDGGEEGGFTERPIDGVKWMYLPDLHGRLLDKQAFGAAMALSCWWKPQRVIVGGDLADFESISKYPSPAEAAFCMGEDVESASWALAQIRRYNPSAHIQALEGNHDRRWHRYMDKHPAINSVLKKKGIDLPYLFDCGEHKVEWIESGVLRANEKFMWKHGNAVRAQSAASARAELERNGISGVSGHTHRIGAYCVTNLTGTLMWTESGCLCGLNPPYAEGQTMNWQQGASLGTVALRGNGFTAHHVHIVAGRARLLGMDISA